VVYPIRFHVDEEKDGSALRSKCMERGRKFWSLASPRLQEYNGQTVLWPKRAVYPSSMNFYDKTDIYL
jgi:hypothetical protein